MLHKGEIHAAILPQYRGKRAVKWGKQALEIGCNLYGSVRAEITLKHVYLFAKQCGMKLVGRNGEKYIMRYE